MDSSPEEFDSIQKLLALKRHEQPPPGYFNYFSDKVISRIEVEELEQHSGWWAWLISRFDAKPILACAYGFTISGLLLSGFRLAQIFEQEAAAAPSPAGPWLATTPDPSTLGSTEFLRGNNVQPANLASFSSLNPVIQPQNLDRGQFRVQPASFSFAH